MAKQPTDKCKWPSPYSPGQWITGRQYILETICINKARSQGKDLPVKFWELPEWKSFYSMQLRAATKLVKKYGEVPVINALKTWQGKKVWSLNAPWLVDLIVQEKQKYESGQEKLGVAEHNRVESPKTPEKKFSNNLMNDLD